MKKSIVLIILLVLGVVAYMVLYPYISAYMLGSKKTNNTDNITFYIPSNSTLEDVSNILLEKQIITDKDTFVKLSKLRNFQKNKVEPGKFVIKPKTTFNQLITDLRGGYAEKSVKLSFHNARTIDDLATEMAKNVEAEPNDFLELLKNEEIAKEKGFNKATFVSMFLPKTYEVYWDEDPKSIIDRLAKEYKKFWNEDRKAKAKTLNLSQSEVTALASIVQEEQSVKIDEQPKIAGLYINRIRRGIKLQADPTVKYALNDFSIRRLSIPQTKTVHPYNTYYIHGIPPGPIRITDTRAIDAVLNYEKHDYIFMCAKPEYTGYHNFAKTNAGHEKNRTKYRNWLNQQNIH